MCVSGGSGDENRDNEKCQPEGKGTQESFRGIHGHSIQGKRGCMISSAACSHNAEDTRFAFGQSEGLLSGTIDSNRCERSQTVPGPCRSPVMLLQLSRFRIWDFA